MKIIYTTDLHGAVDKYHQLEEVASNFDADVVINGGDILPHGTWDNQAKFIDNQLIPHFNYFENVGIDYLVQFGNDDMGCLDTFFVDTLHRYYNIYNVAQRQVMIDDFDFIGMNYVLDYPFRLKDRCRLDGIADDVLPHQYGTAFKSIRGGNGYEEIPDWEQCIHERLTLAEELALLPQPRSDCKLVYVFHQPPANMGLDVCYDGREVGSMAVSEFLTCRDASYSLHGHIHESPVMSGVWKSQLGITECIQPGQLEGFTYVAIDTEIGSIDRFIV